MIAFDWCEQYDFCVQQDFTSFNTHTHTHTLLETRARQSENLCVEMRVFLCVARFYSFNAIIMQTSMSLFQLWQPVLHFVFSSLLSRLQLLLPPPPLQSSSSYSLLRSTHTLLKKCNRVDARSTRNVCDYLHREQFLLSPAYSYSAFGAISFLFAMKPLPLHKQQRQLLLFATQTHTHIHMHTNTASSQIDRRTTRLCSEFRSLWNFLWWFYNKHHQLELLHTFVCHLCDELSAFNLV